VFGAQSIGFAIPLNKAKRDLKELKKYGRIRRPFLGIRYILLNPMLTKRFRLPVENGAFVLREGIPGRHAVMPGSAAYKAGIREGDVIQKLNHKQITEKIAIEDALEDVPIGSTIPVEVWRKGEIKELHVVAEEHAL
ncbi:MAG: PDZ domain-containing protein, partial [Patescibacteria group bacterium]